MMNDQLQKRRNAAHRKTLTEFTSVLELPQLTPITTKQLTNAFYNRPPGTTPSSSTVPLAILLATPHQALVGVYGVPNRRHGETLAREIEYVSLESPAAAGSSGGD